MATPTATTTKPATSDYKIYTMKYDGCTFGFLAPEGTYDNLYKLLNLNEFDPSSATSIVRCSFKRVPGAVRIRIHYEVGQKKRSCKLWCNATALPKVLTQLRGVKYKGKHDITYASVCTN